MTSDSHLLVVGTSAGGTTALPALLAQFKEDMNIVVLIVVHLSKHDVGEMLVQRLQKYTAFTCVMPRHGDKMQRHHIYVARPDHHLMVKGDKILLGQGPMENRYRPSIDALFRSAAVYYGSKAIGIILTGMLEDGSAGMLAIKRSGGICIIQDPFEAQFSDMPRAVLNLLQPDHQVKISEMGPLLSRILAGKGRPKTEVPDDLIRESRLAERVNVGIDELKSIGEHSLYSCPDCGGGLWESKSNDISHYRCHVGHSFTEEGLLSSMEATTESALWTALRIIEERRNLLRKIALKESAKGSKSVAASYQRRLTELEKQIKHLKEVLFTLRQDLNSPN